MESGGGSIFFFVGDGDSYDRYDSEMDSEFDQYFFFFFLVAYVL